MSRATRSIVVAVALIVLLAGCSGLNPISNDSDTPDHDVSQDELVDHAASVDSYSVTVTRTLQAPMVSENTSLEGTIDRDERTAHLYSTSETDIGDSPQTSETEQYVRGDVQYTNDNDAWEASPFDEAEGWDHLDRLETPAETVEDAELERVRTESIDGTETTMYEVSISEDQQSELAGVERQQHVQTSVEQLAYYVYVDTDANELRGTDLRMEVTQGDGTALVTTKTIFSDFDDVDKITIPEAVESDIEE